MSGSPGTGSLVIDTLLRAVGCLQGAGIRVAVIGGIGMNLAGRLRFTRDVDLLVALTEQDVQRAVGVLQAAGFKPLYDPPLRRLDRMSLVQFHYTPSGSFSEIRVDLLLAESDYLRGALERFVEQRFEEQVLPVLAVEDLILLKLLAGRVIDRVDAAELLRLHRLRLDRGYLEHWLQRLELAEIWEQVERESQREPT